jgi:hypothetical protein
MNMPELWNIIKQPNIHAIRGPEGKEKKGA